MQGCHRSSSLFWHFELFLDVWCNERLYLLSFRSVSDYAVFVLFVWLVGWLLLLGLLFFFGGRGGLLGVLGVFWGVGGGMVWVDLLLLFFFCFFFGGGVCVFVIFFGCFVFDVVCRGFQFLLFLVLILLFCFFYCSHYTNSLVCNVKLSAIFHFFVLL